MSVVFGRWLYMLPFLSCACSSQRVDPDFHPHVSSPTYPADGPVVCIDKGHNQSHTAEGLYRPFADLLKADGYRIASIDARFRAGVPRQCRVLVSVNAAGGKTYKLFGLNLPTKSREHRPDPAFDLREVDSVRAWVDRGGTVLLIADHYPYGSASASLAKSFGVEMSGGFTEAANVDPAQPRDHSRLLYSRVNGLLKDDPITNGRTLAERVNTVVTFTGQSLAAPASRQLLALGDSAVDYVPAEPQMKAVSAAGKSQAVALEIGRGRVVVTGEAGAFTAQIDETGSKFGMQLPGVDNQQFVLNALHWLTRVF
ncbi:MAG TPA: hypothetical protein VJ840_15480 [Gemmatimonadaceae bacterium]|nr:hypothetical protein [Gemmatimonadaceae bacterium]